MSGLKVSIITVALNAEKTLQACIRSVASQAYQNIEHIVIDGGSTDTTLEIIKNAPGISQWVSAKDGGLYFAMNKGISMATGEIVGILNADDSFYDDNVIDNIVRVFVSDNCDAVYGDLVFVDPNDIQKIKRKWIAGIFSPALFRNGWMPPHPTFYVRREIYTRHGLFNTAFTTSADYEIMLRFLIRFKIKAVYLNKILICMRLGGKSTGSFWNRLRANQEDVKAWKINGLKPNIFFRFLKPLRKISQFF